MYNIELDDEVVQLLMRSVQRRMTDLTRPFAEAALAIEQRVRDTFRDATDPWGTAWEPLKPSTLAGRARRGNSAVSPLLDTGAMFGALQRDSTSTGFELSIARDGSFPAVHQFGNPNNLAWGRVPAPIPARPFFPIREDGADVDFPESWFEDMLAPFERMFEEMLS